MNKKKLGKSGEKRIAAEEAAMTPMANLSVLPLRDAIGEIVKRFQAHPVWIEGGTESDGQAVVIFGHQGADGSDALDFAVTVSDFQAAADFLARVAAAMRRNSPLSQRQSAHARIRRS